MYKEQLTDFFWNVAKIGSFIFQIMDKNYDFITHWSILTFCLSELIVYNL